MMFRKTEEMLSLRKKKMHTEQLLKLLKENRVK